MISITKVAHFATLAHRNQERKYTGEPYIVHPEAVANIVATVTDDDAMIAAAWLHDTVEDTDVTLDEIKKHFGPRVAQLVCWLTDISKPFHGNREIRKALDREHIALAPAEAQTIKLADLIDNTKSIVTYDPGFARVYLKEKARILPLLDKGHPALRAKAMHSLAWGETELARRTDETQGVAARVLDEEVRS